METLDPGRGSAAVFNHLSVSCCPEVSAKDRPRRPYRFLIRGHQGHSPCPPYMPEMQAP